MTPLKKIESYQTSDGRIFPDIVEATNYQKRLDYHSALDELVDKYPHAIQEELRNFVYNNEDELYIMLLNSGKMYS